MFIKELEIHGFKSYRNQVIIDSFSPAQNTIVGRNGSGKSNSFRAIQFVLGEKQFSNLSLKERKELLHEGAGSTTLSAHVQITFDNSERRFPLETDEVVLRRTIGTKKDEFFLNSKHVTKNDVVSLLESAGFSRSNPYYVVQQGKVNALCLMKDEQRLDLLKEVAGTTVYDQRRKSSVNILADTKQKREKIESVIEYIEKRLDELKDEKEELEEFRSLDRRKRALQYTLYDHELQSATRILETLDIEREKEVEETSQCARELAVFRTEIEKLQSDSSQLKNELNNLKQESKLAEESRCNLVKLRISKDLQHRDMIEREKSLTEQAELYADELQTIEEKLKKTNSELETHALPEMNKLNEEFDKYKHEIEVLERRKFQLESKMGRKSQFSNKLERDEWLKKQISSVENTISEKKQSYEQLQKAERDNLETSKQHLENHGLLLETYQKRENDLICLEKYIQDIEQKRDKAVNDRKHFWREQDNIDRSLDNTKNNLLQAERAMSRSIPVAVANGLSALDSIVEEIGLVKHKQFFGPLYELISAESEAFETAIEVAIGPALTHVIVDTDETASKLMKELQSRKAGRITFKPLNQIIALRQTQDRRYLNDESMDHDIKGLDNSEENPDAIPLITKVNYPPSIKPAVRAILGRVLLCRNCEVAAEKRKLLKVNCVTLEGEEINQRGALTGGFYDPRESKLRLAKDIQVAKEKYNSIKEEKSKFQDESIRLDQLITQLINKLNKLCADSTSLRRLCNDLKKEIQQNDEENGELKKTLVQIKESLINCSRGLEDLTSQKVNYETELASPMLEKLNKQEQKELADLRVAIIEYKRHQTKRAELLTNAKISVNDLKTEISQNLNKRKDELLCIMGKGPLNNSKKLSVNMDHYSKETFAILNDDSKESELFVNIEAENHSDLLNSVIQRKNEYYSQLKTIESRLTESQNDRDDIDQKVSQLSSNLETISKQLEETKIKEQKLIDKLTISEELLDKLLTKRSMQLEKREVSSRKIRELGSLSTNELEKLDRFLNSKALITEIKKINESLLKYNHVNKKALDQFISFADRRETLLERKKELDNAENSISELITHLDQQKENDILRTFRQVSKNFSDVFKKLVPTGKGELVMVTRNSLDEDEQSSNSNKTKNISIDEFVGVSPRVSFNNKEGENKLLMKQLSGGQRALVALTLIFAIQRCDPAPFYLFDEIDSALDPNYRSCVAAMIKQESKHAQFITTTFRPELVSTADACFGVHFQNKISSIEPITNEDALNFVEISTSKDRPKNTTSDSLKDKRIFQNYPDEELVDNEENVVSGIESTKRFRCNSTTSHLSSTRLQA